MTGQPEARRVHPGIVCVVIVLVVGGCVSDVTGPGKPEDGAIEVTIAIDGAGSESYSVAVDGGPEHPLGVNGTRTINHLTEGAHQVRLSGMDADCTLSGPNPRMVSVTRGRTAAVFFELSCLVASAGATGSIRVRAATSGPNADPDGYKFSIDGGAPRSISKNGSVTVGNLATGSHTVLLTSVSNNCRLNNPNPQTVTVTAGATTQVNESITCGAVIANQILFLRTVNGLTKYFLINPDGSGVLQLTSGPGNDQDAAVSPDGTRIVFSSDRGGNFDVYLMNADGTNVVNLTNDPAMDTDPAWSPDGRLVVFESSRSGNEDVWQMDLTGGGLVNLTNSPGDDGDVSYSPDGSRIAFESNRDGNSEIYLMNADGSNQINLTSNPAGDGDPAWSPDGSRIAFGSRRNGKADVYLMNPDGTNPVRLTTSSATDAAPSWSPDGTQIAFHTDRTGNYEVFVMKADGTSQTNLTKKSTTYDAFPEWGSAMPASYIAVAP